jgi:hypothetical protein
MANYEAELRQEPESSSGSAEYDEEQENKAARREKESSNSKNENHSDAPEEIVRRENQIITMFRIASILFLLFAAAATVTVVYMYMARSQMNRFNSEYTALASTVISSLFLDMRRNFWISHSVAQSVTLAMEKSNQSVTNFSIPHDIWDDVTEEARWVAEHLVVSGAHSR